MPAPTDLVLVAGDTTTPLDFVLERRGVPIDVTNAVALEARVSRTSGTTLVRGVSVVDGPAGLVRLVWSLGDLVADADDTPADYAVEVTVDGSTNMVPFRFRVRPRIS